MDSVFLFAGRGGISGTLDTPSAAAACCARVGRGGIVGAAVVDIVGNSMLERREKQVHELLHDAQRELPLALECL